MIDMHAHILPQVDHGSQSVEMSLMLLDAAISAGVETIVATPHFYLHSQDGIKHFISARSRGLRTLKEHMSSAQTERCRILSGCEVNLRLGLSGFDLRPLCIEETNILLLEMPIEKRWGTWVYNEISDIIEKQRLQPLIAHIDRYDRAQVEQLFEDFPLYAQINAGSVVSFWQRRNVMRYLEQDLVWALGSDVHRSVNSYKQLDKLKKHLGPYLPRIEERSASLLVPTQKSQPLHNN